MGRVYQNFGRKGKSGYCTDIVFVEVAEPYREDRSMFEGCLGHRLRTLAIGIGRIL